MKRLPFLFLLVCGALSAARAEEATPTERIREGEAKQQQLRGDAQRIVEQLDSMLDEYQRNQLGGAEIKTLQALRDSLARLSVDEMKRVLDLLEKARAARDAGEAKQRVADAYTDQKAILTEMNKLLAEHLRDQQGQEIAQQLAKLAERQAVNLQNGVTLGQWADGKKPDNFEAAMEANLQGQQGEQAAIADELKALAEQVAAFAKDPGNAEQARRFQKGLEAIQKVEPSVENAVAALKAGQLFKAVGNEKTARDAMRQLAREIAPPPERPEALRAAEKELAKAIEDQKDLTKDTTKAAGEKDFEHWLDEQQKQDPKLAKVPREKLRREPKMQQQFNAQKNGQPEQVAALEGKQGELTARTDEIAQDLARTAPEAARDVKAGTERMQEARGAMSDKNGAAASKSTQEALAALQAADAKLQQEMAKAEALAGKSGDPVKNMQALQQQAQALAQQQAEAAKNPDKSGQPAMAQKVDELAKQAAAMVPAAAAAAQQAAANAQQAAQAAQAGQPAAAAQAQQAAAQNLAQAAQQIAQQAAGAQQAQQQAAASQQAQQKLTEVIIEEQKLQADTLKRAALTEKQKRLKQDTFAAQATRQGEIASQTAELEKTLPDDAPAAKTAIQAAQSAMGDAKQGLEKPDGEAGMAAEKKAIEELYSAMTAEQAAMAQQEPALGQDANAQAAAAAKEAAAELAQAQAQVAQANEALQKAANAAQPAAAQKAAEQAVAELAKAAEEAGKAAAQGMPENAPAQQALEDGAQAAAQGAAQAAAQNIPGAQAQAAAAQQALAQAQAALAQSQAGLTAVNNSGDMPSTTGSPSGQPGQKPGKFPSGQTPGKATSKTPGQPSTEAAQQYQTPGNETAKLETRAVANGKTAFTGLPARERAVIEQAQAEKYPEEYGAQVEQYLLNLARESADKK